MKTRSLFLIITLALVTQCAAQQIFTEVGRVNTVFNYSDSQGEKPLQLFPGAGNSYALGYRMKLNKRVYPTLALQYNRYANRGTDTIQENRFSWDTKYLGLSLGIEGEVYKKRGFTAFVRLAAEPQIMLSGTQTTNNIIYDLKGQEQFDRPFLFYRGGLGINYCADTKVAISLKYQLGKGIPLGSSSDAERLRMTTHTISIGLIWNLRSCKYCDTRFSFK
jgi:hypothetical protein